MLLAQLSRHRGGPVPPCPPPCFCLVFRRVERRWLSSFSPCFRFASPLLSARCARAGHSSAPCVHCMGTVPAAPRAAAPPAVSLAGRSARRRDAREQKHRHGRKLAATRDKEPEGGQPPNTAGGNNARGETAHRETPPANTPPTASPLQEEGRGARLAEVGEDPRTSA